VKLKSLVQKVLGDPNEKELQRMQPLVDAINGLESKYEVLDDAALQAKSEEFRARLAQGETLDDVLVEAFAAVREAAKRTSVGQRHRDVQLIVGIVLHQAKIAEMKTGEGKTLAATLPLYLNALEGKGAHLVTVNDYLARRDGGWMGPIFEALGMSVGLVIPRFSGLYDSNYVDPTSHLEDARLVHWRPVERQVAYRADVTYGTSNEFGFDYLRDNTAHDLDRCVQRNLNFAIIDEVDNILIDEARTPLIISGPVQRKADKYQLFDAIAAKLRRNTAGEDDPPNGDFDMDEKTRAVYLTEPGIARVEGALRQVQEMQADESLYDPQHFELVHYQENALKARHVFRRDVDYVVTQDREVVLVDSRTGRLMPGRRYSEGLHQAIEAKEGVRIRSETVTIASITIQKYFRLYDKLAGMTGTAATEQEEFRLIYNLDVVRLPTNVAHQAQLGVLAPQKDRLGQVEEVTFAGVEPRYHNTEVTVYRGQNSQGTYFERVDFGDVIYQNEAAKLRAIVKEIADTQKAGRPVLVGTTSIESSEELHRLLKRKGIEHAVLNAKQHTEEALVIAQAGQPGSVTVATSMAGRGTDIILGGNLEGLAARYVRQQCFERDELHKVVQLVVGGKSSEARKLVQGKGGAHLGPDTLAWVEQAQREFATRSERVTARGIVPVLVPEVLRTFDAVADLSDREKYGESVRAVVTSIRRGHLRTAREQADAAGLPPEQVDWIVKWIQDHHAFRQRPVEFLTDEMFNRHYNARMALVRAMLSDDLDEARRIASETPGLGKRLIEGIRHLQDDWTKKRDQVWELGGLHILGTERYEARRIDDQFRGRAARQGDPGTSRFFLSLEDELMRRFGGESVAGLMERFKLEDDVPIEAKVLTRVVESAQERLEGYHFDMRKHLLEYDEAVSRQRELIYAERREVLSGGHTDLRDIIRHYFEQELALLVDRYLDMPREWMSGEIASTIAEYSNPEVEERPVNTPVVIRRLRGLLPALDPSRSDMAKAQALRQELETITDAEVLQYELEKLADQALDDQYHVRLFLRSVDRLVPLSPRLSLGNIGKQLARWEAVKSRHAIEQEALGFCTVTLVNLDNPAAIAESADRYQVQMSGFLEALLGEITGGPRRRAERQINAAIAKTFEALRAQAVRNLPKKERDLQSAVAHARLVKNVEDALVTLFQALPQEQVEPTLTGYYDRVLEAWENHISHRAMRSFLSHLSTALPDREEEQFLRGPTQIERELAQAVAGFLSNGKSSMIDEKWPALWQDVKNAYRADRFQEADGAPLAEYEATFAHWLADQTLKSWKAEGGQPAAESHPALEAHVREFLVPARARLAGLELEDFLRRLVLIRMDSEWIQYLEAIDEIRQGIGLQAYGQRSPQVEFHRQAFRMFDELREEVRRQIVGGFFTELANYHTSVQRQRELLRAREKYASSNYRVVKTGKGGRKLVRDVKVGRNDPCWCGSGKKYKRCHMQSDMKKRTGATSSPPRTSAGKKRSRRKRKQR
jgi:preprotein translocase subunit SecA